jgi:hypothetical protein
LAEQLPGAALATRSAETSRSLTTQPLVQVDSNTVSGNLHVDNDSATTDVSGNSVGKNMECENNSTVTHLALNTVKGENQGQCSAFP